MKKYALLAIIACIMPLMPALAQDNDIQQDTLRNFSVKILDRKGKPIPKIVVSTIQQDESFLTDKNGFVTLIPWWYSCPILEKLTFPARDWIQYRFQ
jgi:hypothetical protein